MEISFSGSEVAVITALLGAVVGGFLGVGRMLLAEKDRQIQRLERQNEDLLAAVFTGTKAVENTTTVLKQRATR